MDDKRTWDCVKKPFQAIVPQDSALKDNFLLGFGFIPSSPHLPQQCCGQKKHSVSPILLQIQLCLGWEGRFASFSNITGKVPTLLTSIVGLLAGAKSSCNLRDTLRCMKKLSEISRIKYDTLRKLIARPFPACFPPLVVIIHLNLRNYQNLEYSDVATLLSSLLLTPNLTNFHQFDIFQPNKLSHILKQTFPRFPRLTV